MYPKILAITLVLVLVFSMFQESQSFVQILTKGRFKNGKTPDRQTMKSEQMNSPGADSPQRVRWRPAERTQGPFEFYENYY